MAQIENKKTPVEKVAVKKTTATKSVPAKKAEIKAEVKKTETKKPEVKLVENIKVKYSHPNLKVSPRKLRLLVSEIKKFAPSEALNRLQFVNTNAARQLLPVLKNAINTAKNNYNLNPSSIKFESLMVDEGQKIKRMDKSHGSRFARGLIMKRHSRLNLVLSGTIQG